MSPTETNRPIRSRKRVCYEEIDEYNSAPPPKKSKKSKKTRKNEDREWKMPSYHKLKMAIEQELEMQEEPVQEAEEADQEPEEPARNAEELIQQSEEPAQQPEAPAQKAEELVQQSEELIHVPKEPIVIDNGIVASVVANVPVPSTSVEVSIRPAPLKFSVAAILAPSVRKAYTPHFITRFL